MTRIPPRGDLALAVAMSLVCEVDVVWGVGWRGPTWVNALVVPMTALSLAWRRRLPVVTLAAVLGGLVALSLAFGGSNTWSTLFVVVVAVYSAAASGRHLPVAAGIIAVGVVAMTVRDPDVRTFRDAVWEAPLGVLTLAAGLAGRMTRTRTAALGERARALEHEQEQRAAASAAAERRRIARELHDIISHGLGVVVLQAGAAEQVLDRDPERVREALRAIRATGQDAIAEMGTLLGLIRGEGQVISPGGSPDLVADLPARPDTRGGRHTGAPSRGDLALALALGLAGELEVLFTGDWRGAMWVNAVVVPLTALALAWRRRWPVATLAAVFGGLVALSLAFGGSQTWVSVLLVVIAVYSAAAHGRRLLPAVAVAGVGIVGHTALYRDLHTFGEAIWGPTLVGLTFTVGLAGRTARMRTAALDERARALEREQEQRAAASAAAERRRIARDLHDIISHGLGVVVLQAGAAEQVLDRHPERVREALRAIRATGQDAIAEMGTLLGLMDGRAEVGREPQPSLAELDRLVERTRRAGLPVQVDIEGRPRPLPAALELSAFRVVQEGLTNTLKHAGPARARVLVRYGEHLLEVEVEDDGAGVGTGRGGLRGLAGMGERVSVFGGRLQAGPRPVGAGWGLRAAFPLP